MISYYNLAKSCDFYEKYDFQRIEAPWMVTDEISKITKPKNVPDYHIDLVDKVLVGSAEQSFIYMANKGQLPKGKFMAITPCFRYESIDILHKKTFMKNELINTKNVDQIHLEEMINQCVEFFSLFIEKSKLSVINEPAYKSSINFDIVANVNGLQLELGSYGIRNCEFLNWIYGTGCAEPRLSDIINRIANLEQGKK